MNLVFEVPTKNLLEASKIQGQDEFSFIFDDKNITCHKLIAAFISPIVCNMLISDPTEDKFNIYYPNSHNTKYKERISEILQELVHHYRIELKAEEISFMKEEIKSIGIFCKETDIQNTELYNLLNIIEILGNDELLTSIYQQLFQNIFEPKTQEKSEKNEIENSINYVHILSRMNQLINYVRKDKNSQSNYEYINYISKYLGDKYQEIIDNICEEFYQIEKINEIDENILNDILKSPKLKIINEDWLLEKLLERPHFIEEENQKQNKKIDVYEKNFFIDEVRFEFLSPEIVQKFLDDYPEEDITRNMWNQIKKRLVLPVLSDQINEREMKGSKRKGKYKFSYSCSYDKDRQFDGIMKHLTNITNGNIQNNKTIEITCSHKCCGEYQNVVDFSNMNSYIHVYGNPSPRWLKFDFKNRQIQMNSYLINTGYSNSGIINRSLKSWKVEISNDDTNWETVDEQNDVSEIKENNKIKIFNVNSTSPFRYIQIITDKDNHCNSDGFVIGNFEIYGGIIES